MHFQGKELISRSTHVAHRSLISVASIAIISNLFEFEMYGENGIKIFGMGFPENSIAPITCIIIFFLSINYGLNYWGDYVSFKNWNTDLEKKSGWGGLTTDYESTLKDMKNIKNGSLNIIDYGSLEETRIEENMESLNPKVESLIKGHSQLDSIAKIQLYGWYGLGTAGLACGAFYLSFDCQLIDLIFNLIP